MDSTVVDSTSLATVAYNKTKELLLLEFRSRAIYQYFGVPGFVYQALLQAPSKGRYFNRVIRGRYPYVLLAQPQPGGPHSGRPVER